MSKGLWKGNTIIVKGFSWLKGAEKEVGLLESNILCDKHNSALTDLDTEAKNAFESIERIYDQLEQRKNIKLSKSFSKSKKWYVNGNKFERWAAKLLVGLFCAEEKDALWHDTNSLPLQPPPDFVRAIYGHTQFKRPAGLYLAFASGDQYEHIDGLKIQPLFYPSTRGLMGANVEFKGIRFLIWLSNESVESFIVASSSGTEFGANGKELNYRNEMFKFAVRNVVYHKLIFEWESSVPELDLL